ncbi:hypothetical protein INR49_014722, partial [Caranx melampygus]
MLQQRVRTDDIGPDVSDPHRSIGQGQGQGEGSSAGVCWVILSLAAGDDGLTCFKFPVPLFRDASTHRVSSAGPKGRGREREREMTRSCITEDDTRTTLSPSASRALRLGQAWPRQRLQLKMKTDDLQLSCCLISLCDRTIRLFDLQSRFHTERE